MALLTIVNPTDQPQGKNRLLAELQTNLQDSKFNSFVFIVAFAKVNPMLKLNDQIVNWRKDKSISAVFGVDQKGTSKEALQFALDNFTDTYIIHVRGKVSPTFHPKIYLFKGEESAIGYIGSNNLTVGGTETNFESYIKIVMALPDDQQILKEIESCWDSCIASSIKLNKRNLEQLVNDQLVIDESEMKIFNKQNPYKSVSYGKENDRDPIEFPGFHIIPPSPLPKKILQQGLKRKQYKVVPRLPAEVTFERKDVPVSTLVIEITPHHNGEILLSKIAVDQNFTFFGWPFSGKTIPKKYANPAYPQRVPDPIVDIFLYNEKGELICKHLSIGLNTVYYSLKSEIRITVPQDIIQNSKNYLEGPYPVMVMRNEELDLDLDYSIEIFLPGSKKYEGYRNACNQSMPSGGKSTARRFGWL